MEASPEGSSAVAAPMISQVDLTTFHGNHFEDISIDHFSAHFLGPLGGAEVYTEVEEEDDGLGYYDDGVKRTLTDEQIAIFRHSEIETLLREKRRSDEAKADAIWDSEREIVGYKELQTASSVNADASETLVAQQDEVLLDRAESSTEGQKKKKSHFKRNIKPDLRKRTWDKVDPGLETLDYEEDVTRPSAKRNAGPQRRTISYDDM